MFLKGNTVRNQPVQIGLWLSSKKSYRGGVGGRNKKKQNETYPANRRAEYWRGKIKTPMYKMRCKKQGTKKTAYIQG